MPIEQTDSLENSFVAELNSAFLIGVNSNRLGFLVPFVAQSLQ